MRFFRRQDTPVATFAACVLLLLLAGCARTPHDAPPASTASLDDVLQQRTPRSEDALRVRLVFGAAADLDLYVTDPRQETVYFANNPTRSGGRLHDDVRCGAPVPRVEVVEFDAPAPGRYRVGVDFPKHCGGGSREVPFVVEVAWGDRVETRRGEITPLVFQPIVLEVEFP